MKMKNMKLSLIAVFSFLVCCSLVLSAVSALAGGGLTGKVKETMVSGGYSYMLLETSTGEIWAAVPRMEVKAGDEVDLKPGMVMTNFTSKTMGRTFPEIVFSAGPMSPQAPVAKDAEAAATEQKPLSLTVAPGEITKPDVLMPIPWKSLSPRARSLQVKRSWYVVRQLRSPVVFWL